MHNNGHDTVTYSSEIWLYITFLAINLCTYYCMIDLLHYMCMQYIRKYYIKATMCANIIMRLLCLKIYFVC